MIFIFVILCLPVEDPARLPRHVGVRGLDRGPIPAQRAAVIVSG